MKHSHSLARAAAVLVLALLTSATAWATDYYVTVNVTGSGSVTVKDQTATESNPAKVTAAGDETLTLTFAPETGNIVTSAKYSYTFQNEYFEEEVTKEITIDGLTGTLDLSEFSEEIKEGTGVTVNIAFGSSLMGGTEDAPVAITEGSLRNLGGGYYTVAQDVEFSGTVVLYGNTVLTLASGATMTINASSDHGINGNQKYSLTVGGEGSLSVTVSGDDWAKTAIYDVTSYKQTGGSVTLSAAAYGLFVNGPVTIIGGSLSATATTYGSSIWATDITISGGTVSATGAQYGIYANTVSITGGTVTASGRIGSDIYGYEGVNITGGQVTAQTKGISTEYNAAIALGYSSADDFIKAKGFNSGTVSVQSGKVLTDGSTTYTDVTASSVLAALTDVTLRPVTYTVTFDINYDEGTDPGAQTVLQGEKATEPSVTRTGYTVIWKNGEEVYDFNTPVTADLNLSAAWTPITYTVQFNKNNDAATGSMASVTATYNQWTAIPACTFTAPSGYVLKEYGWNTAADGSGDSYFAENGDFWNLASEQDAVVTLYAQWGKDISTCTAEVPDQTKDTYAYIYYKFEAASGNPDLAREMGAVVKDGNKTLSPTIDYRFGNVVYADGREGMPENVGDECLVEICGKGEYSGSMWVPFMITTPDADGTWGDLAWSFHAGTLTINKKDGVTGDVAMETTNQGSYPWFSIANCIKTVTLGEGITTIAAEAFAGSNNVHSYGNLAALNIPSTLTTIDERAFAFCSGLTIDLDAILANNITIGTNAFYNIGCLTGSLADHAGNTTKIAQLSQAYANVTLSGRTLYKDDKWNTLCLPFSLTAEQIAASPLADCTLMALDGTTSNLTDGTLMLTFKTATSITAGTPYIIKWAAGDDIVDPVFTGVAIENVLEPVKIDNEKVSFTGTYVHQSFDAEDKDILFMGGANTLYYPQNGASIGAFRAYFQINSELSGVEDDVKAFVLNFGDEADGIVLTDFTDSTDRTGAWFTLDGQRLNGKPTAKGLYINNGHKIIIK